MRVQSVSQSQKAPSFQARCVFVKKCLDDMTLDGVYETGRKLAAQLIKEKIPHSPVLADSVSFRPYATITVETNSKHDKLAIPMFEKFAEENGFEKDIKPGCILDSEALVATARELVSKLKSN